MRVFKQVPRILFGRGSLGRLGELLPANDGGHAYSVFVVDDVHRATALEEKLMPKDGDMLLWFDATEAEPATDQVDALRDRVLDERNGGLPSAIIGVGGGSTMDVAKALSVVLTNGGSSSDYQGWDLVTRAGVYKLGVPTLAGSGSEASRTAVLMGEDRKMGINSDFSMFDAIILDSTLIETVPRDQRFYSGMDCFIHCVESIQGTMINELALGYASKALELCDEVFCRDGDDDQLMTASFLGGCSIVNSEVGLCHALSYGLSLELGLRHGLANCIVFTVLDEFYGHRVELFREIAGRHEITIPSAITADLDAAAMERMIDTTFRMERPLINTFGADWREKLTPERVVELYRRM